MPSIFAEHPDRSDKSLLRALEKSLAGGDVSASLDMLGEAPGLIYDRELSSVALTALAARLAEEQIESPSPHAKGLMSLSGAKGNLLERLQADLEQRLPRRLGRWQTGPGAARSLASDLHEAALADMVATTLTTKPDKLEKALGAKRTDSLAKDLRRRGAIKGKLSDNLDRCDWIAIIDDIGDASEKEQLADGLDQGLRRYFEVVERGRIFPDSY